MNLPDRNSSLDELKPFSDIDYIITDLDGTFVQCGEGVWEQLCGIQSKLYHSNQVITIATGRTYCGMISIAESIKIRNNTPICLYNGAVVMSYGSQNILYQKTIPNSVLFDLCKLIDFNKHNLLAYYFQIDDNKNIVESVHGFGKKTSKYDFNGMEITWHNIEEIDYAFYSSYNMLNNKTHLIDNIGFPLNANVPEASSILIDKKIIQDIDAKISNYLLSSNLVSNTQSGSSFYEVRAFGVNKGSIFDCIKKMSNAKCVAIGDNDNDIELLRNADIGVAVADASSEALEYADFICHYSGTKGVLELLEVIKSANRYCERGKKYEVK